MIVIGLAIATSSLVACSGSSTPSDQPQSSSTTTDSSEGGAGSGGSDSGGGGTAGGGGQEQSPADSLIYFAITIQDFAYPEKSIEHLQKVVDLHESLGVPLDLSFTTSMVDAYEDTELFKQIKTSPVAVVSYHVRPPVPYYDKCDWRGFGALSDTDKATMVEAYETQALDLETGMPIDNVAGGYAHLTTLLGYPPFAIGVKAAKDSEAVVMQTYGQLGARFVVVHATQPNLGDKKHGMWVRPQHVDLKLFEEGNADAVAAVDKALADSRALETAEAPYIVGVKMHDNDFFSSTSAWTTVYFNPSPVRCQQGPDFDLSQKAPLLDQAARDAMWARYQAAVEYVATFDSSVRAVNAADLEELVDQQK